MGNIATDTPGGYQILSEQDECNFINYLIIFIYFTIWSFSKSAIFVGLYSLYIGYIYTISFK